MAGPLGVGIGDLIAVSKLCFDIVEYISDIEEAPEVFENYVIELRLTSSVFESIADGLAQSQSTTPLERIPSTQIVDQQLQSSISRARVSLQSAAVVLAKGYRGKAASASPSCIRRFWKLSRWPRTCQRFEECLEQVHRATRLILLLMGTKNITTIDEMKKSLADLELGLNRKPPQMSLPGSGGSPEDHIRIEDGLGATRFLPLAICTEPDSLHNFLEIMLKMCPGERRICQRHYKLYNANFGVPIEMNSSNWAYYAQSGSKILLAFVVGTWQMSALNFCPLCNHRNPGEWYKWRNCRCGFSYFVTEAGEVEYEPYIGGFTGKGGADRVWKRSTQETSSCHAANEVHLDTGSDTDDVYPQGTMETQVKSIKFKEEELYLKRQVLVYDPIFNFVHRNMICRCIVGITSIKSTAPRVQIPTMEICTKHRNHRIAVDSLKHVLSLDLDYHEDEYFEAFGGYRKFLAVARVCAEGTVLDTVVDLDSLCDYDDALEMITDLTVDEMDAIDRYRYEVWEYCKCDWEARRKSYESLPHVVANIEKWLRTERENLTYIAEEIEEERMRESEWKTMYANGKRLITVLKKGRVLVKEVDVSDLEDTVV